MIAARNFSIKKMLLNKVECRIKIKVEATLESSNAHLIIRIILARDKTLS